jgi:hypothetical protein
LQIGSAAARAARVEELLQRGQFVKKKLYKISERSAMSPKAAVAATVNCDMLCTQLCKLNKLFNVCLPFSCCISTALTGSSRNTATSAAAATEAVAAETLDSAVPQ